MADKSTASLTVVPVRPLERVRAPDDLTEEEAALWRKIVEAKPAEWFGEDSAPVLLEYVRAKISCDQLHKRVTQALDNHDDDELQSVMRLRDMESRRLVSLATKLRLTQQSRYTPKAAATADRGSGAKKLWQRS
jgi:hypothetical protein